jgi:GNAT superfamily N-acetyltransferase
MLRLALGWRIVPSAHGGPPPVLLPPRALDDLGRPGDGGIVATYEGEPAGACWYRLPEPARADPGGAAIPRLTIAVLPQHRARGVGGTLLDAGIEHARRAGHEAIDLVVEHDNPARAMYERRGFETLASAPGRHTMRMLLRTPSQAPVDGPDPTRGGAAGPRSSRSSSR